MEEILREVLENFYQLTKLPVRWVVGEDTVLRWGTSAFSEAYDRDILKQLQQCDGSLCYQITPEQLIYGFIRLRDPRPGGYLMVGPALMDGYRHKEVIRLSEAFHHAVSHALWDFVNALSVWHLEHFYSAMNTLFAALHRNDLAEEGYLHHHFSVHLKNEDPSKIMPVGNRFIGYNLSEEIVYYIKNGQTEELRTILTRRNETNQVRVPVLDGVSSLRTTQDIMITWTTICVYIAVESGVDITFASEWGDRFVTLAERIRSIPEAEYSAIEMMVFFAEQIAKTRRFPDQDELVRKTAAYISGHLSEKVSVQKIAEALNMNASYLSHQFKERTGKALSDFIAQEKVEEAKKMLQRGRDSILEISQHLGFSSQQYFQNVFKKTTGTTPAQYQKSIKNG